MKKLFTTLGIIFAVAGSSLVFAASDPQWWWNVSSVHIIPNEACIQYIADWIVQKACDTVYITYHDASYACLSITSSGSVVELDDDGKWTMKFRCDAVSSGSHSFHIDCGNWETYNTTTSNWFATYTCHYTSGDAWKYFTWSCLVDDDSSANPSCKKEISIDYTVPNCWDGIIKPGEYCDLGWQYDEPIEIFDYLDSNQTVTAWQFANHWYTCLNCMIMTGSNYVYEPAECLYTDTPISVMNNEIMPFWWRLWIENAETTSSEQRCNNWDNENTTLLWKPSMKCHFAVYNWNHKQWEQRIQHYVTGCYNDYFDEEGIFEYFKEHHQTSADWASIATVNAVTHGLSNTEYWEYKLVLEKVEYQYCANGGKHTGERYWAVCEVDFVVTKPYVMQISTFGVNPIWATNKDFLYDFYDMKWNPIIEQTDLKWIMNISSWTYASEQNIQDEIQKFQDKYEKLAVKVNNSFHINGTTTIGEIFWNDKTVKKVPNQHIYFIQWNGTLKLTQDKIEKISPAYTIFVDWMDVEIEWNVLQYAMIISTNKIIFKDKWGEGSSRCASWWQVVQWLFIAWDWFKGDANHDLWNTNPSKLWCPWWWLQVKWVLIWSWVTNLMNSKRSQLNSWFNSSILRDSAIKTKRRQLIIWWASVLIEYNPSLWKTLPPGAEIFTESLEVYRR